MKNHEKAVKPTQSQHPGWLEINVEIHSDGHEALSSFLFDIGCEGIESGSSKDNSLKAFITFRENLEQLRSSLDSFLQELTQIFPNIITYKFSVKIIEEQDWNAEWRKFFKPERITKRLIITPEWEPTPDHTDVHVIRIDPGPAFGSGKHPTTRMCLAAMEKIKFPDSWNMLDVGTGSGILAIYGIMLGASGVTAVDIDPEAIRWAQWNIDLNKLPQKIYLTTEKLDNLEGPFFLITANLIMGTIIELLPVLANLLVTKGYLILSGIHEEQVRRVEQNLVFYNLEKYEILHDEEWACIIVKPKE